MSETLPSVETILEDRKCRRLISAHNDAFISPHQKGEKNWLAVSPVTRYEYVCVHVSESQAIALIINRLWSVHFMNAFCECRDYECMYIFWYLFIWTQYVCHDVNYFAFKINETKRNFCSCSYAVYKCYKVAHMDIQKCFFLSFHSVYCWHFK